MVSWFEETNPTNFHSLSVFSFFRVAIVEFVDDASASIALTKCQDFALDKNNKLNSYSFDYFKKIMATKEVFEPVQDDFEPLVNYLYLMNLTKL